MTRQQQLVLMKKVFNALKRHKNKYPMETIRLLQKLYNVLKRYKQDNDEDDDDCNAFFRLRRNLKNDRFVLNHIDYIKAKNKISKMWANQQLLFNLDQEMKSTLDPIKCIKYNYAIAKNVQNQDCQDGKIEVSQNGESLLIYNIWYITKENYVLEADPSEVEKMMQEQKDQDQNEKF